MLSVCAATKTALKSISDGIRKEVVENDIRATNIQPGLYVINLPKHVQINQITVTPLHQATVEVIHKNT